MSGERPVNTKTVKLTVVPLSMFIHNTKDSAYESSIKQSLLQQRLLLHFIVILCRCVDTDSKLAETRPVKIRTHFTQLSHSKRVFPAPLHNLATPADSAHQPIRANNRCRVCKSSFIFLNNKILSPACLLPQ